MTNHPNRSKQVDRSAINAAELEGKVVLVEGKKYLCTFGNGCSPRSLGSKIFAKDIVTGITGLLYREDIDALCEDTVLESDLPKVFDGFVSNEATPDLIGFSFSGAPTLWMHKDAVKSLTKALVAKALA